MSVGPGGNEHRLVIVVEDRSTPATQSGGGVQGGGGGQGRLPPPSYPRLPPPAASQPPVPLQPPPRASSQETEDAEWSWPELPAGGEPPLRITDARGYEDAEWEWNNPIAGAPPPPANGGGSGGGGGGGSFPPPAPLPPPPGLPPIDAVAVTPLMELMELFALFAPEIAIAVGIMGTLAYAASEVVDEFDKLSEELKNYEANLAAAKAEQEVAYLLNQIESAERQGPQLARYTEARTEVGVEFDRVVSRLENYFAPVVVGGMKTLADLAGVISLLTKHMDLMPDQLQELRNGFIEYLGRQGLNAIGLQVPLLLKDIRDILQGDQDENTTDELAKKVEDFLQGPWGDDAAPGIKPEGFVQGHFMLRGDK